MKLHSAAQRIAIATATLILFLSSTPVPASAQSPEGVYIIFDASGSMWGQLADKTHKIEAARSVLKEFVGSDFEGRELALRAYGHNRKGDCADTELVVPFSSAQAAAGRMSSFADAVNPKGKTPISRSLRAALDDFGDRRGEIILISDGIETCDEDPCELVRAWRESEVQIRVHVVGLGLQGKEKTAMQCISDAAGTEYQDAQSAEELTAGLSNIRERSGKPALALSASFPNGERAPVEGTATSPGGESFEVSNNGRFPIPPGPYTVEVGVRTRNGSLYKAVSKQVEVAEAGETRVEFTVEEPASVKARFVENGEEARGALVTAYRDGEKLFKFRWIDRIYLEAGAYEFRSQPNADNDLSVKATITERAHEEIVFGLIQTVRARIKLVATGSGLDFRHNYELWQNGEKVRNVHWNNGVRAQPGTYDLHLPSRLTPYVHQGLVLTDEKEQEFRIEIPAAHLTVIYQKADGSRDKDERIFVARRDGERWVRDKVQSTGKRIPLVPGEYRIEGWKQMGNYEVVTLTMVAGDEKEIILRDQG